MRISDWSSDVCSSDLAGDSAKFKATLAAIWQGDDAPQALRIDPRLFRAFGIEAAPSVVMVGSDFAPCDGFDCRNAPPPHARPAGTVHVSQVLQTFPAGNSPGPPPARLPHPHPHTGLAPYPDPLRLPRPPL